MPASWTVSGIALQKLLVPGTVSALLMAGSGFQQSTSVDQSLAAVNNAVPASVTVSVVFTGTLTSITNSTSDAFTFGEGTKMANDTLMRAAANCHRLVIVSSEDKKLAIRYQNENILAWELYGDGTPSQTAPIVVAPDALCYLQNANGQPLSNVELQAAYDKGQRPVLTIVKVKRYRCHRVSYVVALFAADLVLPVSTQPRASRTCWPRGTLCSRRTDTMESISKTNEPLYLNGTLLGVGNAVTSRTNSAWS